MINALIGPAQRFARHALVPGWNQERLAAAEVVILGVGALGNTVAQTLALAGVGTLLLCDHDVVSESNLSRTPLFRPADIGRPKVHAATQALSALVPGLVVKARHDSLVSGVGLGELRRASLVLGCLDSRAARLTLAGRCGLVGAPLIDGGTDPWSGEVRPYLQPDGPCFGCAQSAANRAVADVPWSCLDARRVPEVGAHAAVSALVGSWMAVLAVQYLIGMAVPPHTLAIDLAAGSAHPVSIARSAGCPYHELLPASEPISLGVDATVGELASVLSPGEHVLAWTPVLCRQECSRGHFAREVWGRPRAEACPQCGATLRARTTLELTHAPAQLPLTALGIAPREILPVRARQGMRFLELAGASVRSKSI